MRFRTLPAALAVVCTASSFVHAQSPRALRSSDIYRLRDVGAARISPDGAWIAYTVTTTDSAKDKSDSDVWMVSWDGTRTLRMTASPEPESNPRFSPDNRYLSFVSGRYESKGGQIWLLDRGGGEAVRLTDFKGGVNEYEWSPDATHIVVVSQDPDPEDAKPDSLKTKSTKEHHKWTEYRQAAPWAGRVPTPRRRLTPCRVVCLPIAPERSRIPERCIDALL